MEKISDAQMGKVLKDVQNRRVRVEQYVLRPAPDKVELLNVNLRAGEDLTTMEWVTRFNNSLDGLPTGSIKNLPWNDYLNTQYKTGVPGLIISPEHPSGIYPNEMSIKFSHAEDAFAESRSFSPRNSESGRQMIHDMRLWVKDFNNNEWMDYNPNTSSAAGKYSITSNIPNAYIGDNPTGFRYDFMSKAGDSESIEASFYVLHDSLGRQDSSLSIRDLPDALRINMSEELYIGENNLEMVFSSTSVFTSPIDLIYVPMLSGMGWKSDIYGEQYVPDYSLPPEAPEGLEITN